LRILLINPNTTESVTALVAGHARAIAGDAATFVPVTGRFGARYISTRAAAAIAAHAALDVLAEHVAGCDASISPASAILASRRCGKSRRCR